MKKLIAVTFAMLLAFTALPLSTSALTLNYTPSSSYRQSNYYTALTNVTLTGDYHKDIVAVALSQVGYHESNSSSKLGGNTSGSYNYTEYGRWAGNNGQAWCAYFISWCARAARIPTSVIKTTGLAAAGYFGVQWHERSGYTPKPGDIIVFDYPAYCQKTPKANCGDHVGIVVDYDGTYVYTVEGNSGNSVQRCKYKANDSDIKGYGTYSTPNTSSAEKEPANEVVGILRANIGFKATLTKNAKVNAYSSYGGSKVGRVYENDVFTVNEIKYHNGEWWCKIACPWSENGRSYTKNVYIKLTDVVPALSYDAWQGRANGQITTYKHADRGATTGYIGSGDIVFVVTEYGGAMLVLYPLAGGGAKLGWI